MEDIKAANYIYSGNNICNNSNYKQINIDIINQYLCFYAHEDSTIIITKQSISDNSVYHYIKESTILNHNNQGYDNQVNNRDMASTFLLSNSPINIELTHGDRLYLWIDSTNTNANNYNKITITGTGKYSVSGNVMSLFNKNLPESPIPCFESLFKGNTALYDASGLILPGDGQTLPENCFDSLFKNCTQLRYPPKLPGTAILNSYCYSGMFQGCTSLIVAPDINNTQFKNNSSNEEFSYMFQGCTSLIQAPNLYFSINSGGNTCQGMFRNCTNLILGPEEIRCSTELCCSGMFYNCTSLIKAPKLPNMQLDTDCYNAMFYGCTSLEEAPVLPALELGDNSYFNMFKGCIKLKYIEAHFLTNLYDGTNSATEGWVDGVAAEGVILLNPENEWFTDPDNHRGVNEIPTGWYVADMNYDYSPYDDMYLTFESLANNNTFTYHYDTSYNNIPIQYSIDNGKTWTLLSSDIASPVRNKGQKIMWKRSSALPSLDETDDSDNFTSTGKFNVYGNITSLTHGDDFRKYKYTSPYSYHLVFYNCSNLISAKNLRILVKPSNNDKGKLFALFNGCTQLVEGPELIYPFVETDTLIFESLFNGCDSLKRLYVYILHEYREFSSSTFPSAIIRNVYIWDSPLNNYYFKGTRTNGTREYTNNKNTFHKDLKVINRNYISTHGTQSTTVANYQSIDLEYVPTANTGISITAKCDNTTDRYLIACRNGTSSQTRFGIGHSSGYYYGWGGYMSGSQTSTYNTTDWRNIKLNYLNDGYFSINSEDEQTTYYNRLISNTTSTSGGVDYPLNFTPRNTLALFAMRTGTTGTTVAYPWTGSIKSVQITEGENIVMDLIPISIYGAAGFYDKIGRKYYGQYFYNRTVSKANYLLEYH